MYGQFSVLSWGRTAPFDFGTRLQVSSESPANFLSAFLRSGRIRSRGAGWPSSKATVLGSVVAPKSAVRRPSTTPRNMSPSRVSTLVAMPLNPFP